MRTKIFHSLVCLVSASLVAFPAYASHTTASKQTTPYEVYVDANYKNQPDLLKYGIKDVAMIYVQNLWAKGQDRQLLPSKDRVIKYVAGKYANYTGLLVLDIEQWPLIGSDAQVASRLKKSITVLEWAKSAAPKAKVGYYSVSPPNGYWPCQKGGSTYHDWQKKNNRGQALADKMDVFLPSLYPVHASHSKWAVYAACMIEETKRLGKGKPVYPVIQPRYHSKAYDGLGSKKVPKEFFLFQLETIKAQPTAGVIIWTGNNHSTKWTESLPWWQATKEFLGLK